MSPERCDRQGGCLKSFKTEWKEPRHAKLTQNPKKGGHFGGQETNFSDLTPEMQPAKHLHNYKAQRWPKMAGA